MPQPSCLRCGWARAGTSKRPIENVGAKLGERHGIEKANEHQQRDSDGNVARPATAHLIRREADALFQNRDFAVVNRLHAANLAMPLSASRTAKSRKR